MNSSHNLVMISPYPHFTEEEFNRAIPSCSLLQMDSTFMKHIEEARERSGVPFIVNSAYRTVDWEHDHGRSGNSFHCVGQALDIRCTDSIDRYKIIEAIMFYGNLSVMVYPTFLHVDNRLPKKLMVYKTSSDTSD